MKAPATARKRSRAERLRAEERARAMHDEVALLLSLHQRRYTRNCRRFVDAVINGGRPLTAEEACEVDPDLALSTVYRLASTLVDVGALRSIPTTDGMHRFDVEGLCSDCFEGAAPTRLR